MNIYKENIDFTLIFMIGWCFLAAGPFDSLLKFLPVLKWY